MSIKAMRDKKRIYIAKMVYFRNILRIVAQRDKFIWKLKVRKRRRLLSTICCILSKIQQSNVRRFWMLNRSNEWWSNAQQNYTDELWLKHFRMTKSTFKKILNNVKEDLMPDEKAVRTPIPFEKRVAIAIFQLASSAEFRTTGIVFGVSESSVHKYFHIFCKAMLKNIKKYIKIPQNEEALDLAYQNQHCNKFPQLWGAIDGCHIHVSPPLEGSSDYINRKMFPSLVLQAVVDKWYRFRDISVKMPGSSHDAAVLKNSNLYQMADQILPKGDITINGVEIPLMIAGDAAYPLMPWLIKPYVGSNLTVAQISFNCYHSSSRIVVENAFGRLKARWRILQKRIAVKVSDAPRIVATCCILHNICENEQTPDPPDFTEIYPSIPDMPQSSGLTENSLVRDTICQYLSDNYAIRTSNRF